MTVASDLLQRHVETLLSPGEWEALIADDIVWELPFAPSLGHPGRLEGRDAVEKHVKWFRGAVEDFRFSDLRARIRGLIPMGPAAKSGQGAGSRRRAARMSKSTCFSCARRAVGSLGCGSTSIRPAQPRRWIVKSRNGQAARFLPNAASTVESAAYVKAVSEDRRLRLLPPSGETLAIVGARPPVKA